MNILSISGGKDSTAMLLLAIERGVEDLRCIFADTGNEHPKTIEYIGYLQESTGIKIETIRADFSKQIAHKRELVETKWRAEGVSEQAIADALSVLKPSGNAFLDLCLVKGRFPSTMARFCTAELKVQVVRDQIYTPVLAAGIDIDSWQGIRHDESKSRSCAVERDLAMKDENTGAECWNYRPILDWKAEDCFAMMRKHGIKPNPMYSLGMTRVGCMPCINARKAEIAEISMRFPEEIDRIARWEDAVSKASRRRDSTFFPTSQGKGDGIYEIVQWAKTDRGGRQFGMFDWIDLPACSSQYGLCE